jgi:hypothetical protein
MESRIAVRRYIGKVVVMAIRIRSRNLLPVPLTLTAQPTVPPNMTGHTQRTKKKERPNDGRTCGALLSVHHRVARLHEFVPKEKKK